MPLEDLIQQDFDLHSFLWVLTGVRGEGHGPPASRLPGGVTPEVLTFACVLAAPPGGAWPALGSAWGVSILPLNLSTASTAPCSSHSPARVRILLAFNWAQSAAT